MMVLAWIAAFGAAAFHVAAFYMESIGWMTPGVQRRFRQTPEHAEVTRVLAFNQGFYNLFLAAGVAVGFAWYRAGHGGGVAIAAWCCLSMLGAALVLIGSARGMGRAAILQGGPPLLFLVLLLLRRFA